MSDLLKRINIILTEETEYQKFFKKKMKEWGISSPAELSDEDKKKFYDEIDKEWTGEKDEGCDSKKKKKKKPASSG